MQDLYALALIIKNHPSFKSHREAYLHLFRTLGQSGSLSAESLMVEVKNMLPASSVDFQKSYSDFKLNYDEGRRLQALGIAWVIYGQKEYPQLCYWMVDPPLILFIQGHLPWVEKKNGAISIVGSREPCFDSLQWMEHELSTFFTQQEPLVVSGGARGVDQKAHALAIRKKLPTLVILPSGLGRLYPESLAEWVSPVIDQGGALVSEYGFDQKMHKHLFHHRNRLIAALGNVTLLIQAKRRSGTLITAQQALNLGRPVWVVPGHPRDSQFGGSLDLLADGACLVRDAQDLAMYFNSEFLLQRSGAENQTIGLDCQLSGDHYQ